jgi:hypothetical protein
VAEQQQTKQERQAAARLAAEQARMAAFLDKGNPEAHDAPAEPPAPDVEGEAPASDAQPAVEAASEPAEAVADAEAPAAAQKPASKGKKGRDAGLPWANAHPRVKVNFSTQFSEEQHMKLTWLTENMTGRQSIQKLVHEAVDALLDKRIKEILKS